MKISVVLPVYNEEKNIPILYKELTEVLLNINVEYEVIIINDASRDKSLEVIRELAQNDNHVKVVNFKWNSGQTAAMSAGIKLATGDIIIPMDSDLQNDPNDIPEFLSKLNEGFDVVSGWRKNRKDFAISRRLPSVIANWLIRKITGVKIHDYGCSMKAYRSEIIKDVLLYGEMHRFIPAYTAWHGGKITEIVVNHRARTFGKTNYGIGRTFNVLLDLVVVKFLSKYMNRPMHFFGGIGFVSFFIGLLMGTLSVVLKFTHLRDFVDTPLPVFSALFIIVGAQMIAMGVIAEMLMRVYYESQNKTPYQIRETINF
ncbi:glycosyltransferase family 2 protein [Patescibacteria group bacterium]|nr:glycosyltransferase family 2 protein [Patescibacteria group bacterium]